MHQYDSGRLKYKRCTITGRPESNHWTVPEKAPDSQPHGPQHSTLCHADAAPMQTPHPACRQRYCRSSTSAYADTR
eukprot:88511-Pleurochrysis_carterae.AAC.10